MRLRILVVALLAALAAFAATASQADASRVPRLKHVWVFVLENHSYDEIIDNPDVPYLNHLAHRHAMATQDYAVAHPSLPNYLAMISGSTHSCTSNGVPGQLPRAHARRASSQATGCGGEASSRASRSPATPAATAGHTPATTTRSSTSEASCRSRASGTGSSPSASSVAA